ncbi:MAG TPA: bifunctional 5,10-methylenetetrahydrofolate dehydrogenase/5,10-methenyltetrahydrofolate cyclohydrolase [bacterium]|nr:bifunctional 5,10-methylenetetrahydrofolate dehydrogenase/5,10-methenyltetrahydrofolate cyclohydrolase [bacterium]
MLLKGKELAGKIVKKLQNENLPPLTLAVFHPVGDQAAESYLKMKERWLKKINAEIRVFPVYQSTPLVKFYEQLDEVNNDPSVHGIMVELPLPIEVNYWNLHTKINPRKDVDGITFHNQGEFFATITEKIVPCTSVASIRLLEHYEIPLVGKHALVIGRSNIVGLPLFKLFLNRNATPAIAHRHTHDMKTLVKNSDVIAIAAGKKGLVDSSDVKDGATVIDIGINMGEDGKLCGDFNITSENEKERINYSPVPGGVGVVTNAVMLENLSKCYKMLNNISQNGF